MSSSAEADGRDDVRRVVHDLNNALTIISGELQLLEVSLDDDATNREAFANIREALIRAVAAAKQLL